MNHNFVIKFEDISFYPEELCIENIYLPLELLTSDRVYFERPVIYENVLLSYDQLFYERSPISCFRKEFLSKYNISEDDLLRSIISKTSSTDITIKKLTINNLILIKDWKMIQID